MPKFIVTKLVRQDSSVEIEAQDETSARVVAKALQEDDWQDEGGNVEYEVEEIE